MVWDLRGALLKKEERESARLMDFEFRLRARTFRLMAEKIGRTADRDRVVGMIAKMDDDAILAELAKRFPEHAAKLPELYAEAGAEARKQLIAERGDPSPYRLL